MKLFKLLFWLLGILAAVIVGVFIYLSLNLSDLVKEGVETLGPELTGTPVGLNSVDISLREGLVSLKGFSVDNPQGFSTNKAISFDEFSIQIDPESLAREVKVVEKIIVSGVAVVAEQKGSKLNLREIKKSLDNYLPATDSGDTGQADKNSAESVRFHVKQVVFEKARLTAITDRYGENSSDLPSFEINNIGSAEKGVSADELASLLLKRLNTEARKQVERELKGQAKDEVKSKIENKLKDKLKGLL